MPQDFSPGIVGKIKFLFWKENWNLYSTIVTSHGSPTSSVEEVIRAGPVQVLERGQHYFLLPLVEEDKNPGIVLKALEYLVQQLRGKLPTITVLIKGDYWSSKPEERIDRNERYPLLHLTPTKKTLVINGKNPRSIGSPIGQANVDYDSFLRSMTTIVNPRNVGPYLRYIVSARPGLVH